ncbi:unnamed protein product [Coccothraustes coccothraustes]
MRSIEERKEGNGCYLSEGAPAASSPARPSPTVPSAAPLHAPAARGRRATHATATGATAPARPAGAEPAAARFRQGDPDPLLRTAPHPSAPHSGPTHAGSPRLPVARCSEVPAEPLSMARFSLSPV